MSVVVSADSSRGAANMATHQHLCGHRRRRERLSAGKLPLTLSTGGTLPVCLRELGELGLNWPIRSLTRLMMMMALYKAKMAAGGDVRSTCSQLFSEIITIFYRNKLNQIQKRFVQINPNDILFFNFLLAIF